MIKTQKTIQLLSAPIEISSYQNHKEAIFLISVLDEYDRMGRMIPKSTGENCYQSIIGYPILAKLLKDKKGNPSDFGGHELQVKKDKKGNKTYRFNTCAIGSVIDSWIEEREVVGYEGKKKCILIKAKLWTSRFPEYFVVFDKLWEAGKLETSWEISVSEDEKVGNNTILKVIEFIGDTLLGSKKMPAVPSAGLLEYAEYEEDGDIQLAEALEKDIANSDIDIINKNEDEEEINLASKTIKASQDSTAIPTAVLEDVTSNNTSNTETAALTVNDLRSRIRQACEEKLKDYCYIAFFFPEEHQVWVEDYKRKSQLEYKLFTYSVENDVVSVSDPQDVVLTVSVAEINGKVAELKDSIATLEAEIKIKDSAITTASTSIHSLEVKISELKVFKDKVEIAEKEKVEAQIAEDKKALKEQLLKGGLFTEPEIADSKEILEIIDSRDEAKINKLIADKYIASLENAAKNGNEPTTATASLETDESDSYSPKDIMRKILNI